MILFSCVRTSRHIGFLSDERRLNVALTRAKHALILIGSAASLGAESRSNGTVWKDLINFLRGRSCVYRLDDDSLASGKPGEVVETSLPAFADYIVKRD